MILTFKKEENWHNVQIPSNDFYKDTIVLEIEKYCKNNNIDTANSKVNILDITNTSLDVRDYIIVTFSINSTKELQ